MTRALATRLALVITIVVILVIFVFPYLYLILTSLKTPTDALSIPPSLFPKQISFESYSRITDFPAITKSFRNSLIIALGVTVLATTLAVPASYAVSRYGTLPGQIFMVIALVTRMVPYVSIAVPFFVLMNTLDLLDTHFAVILAHTTMALPLAIWLMASFFEGIPNELEEAAKVDGCSRLGALVRVIVPVSIGGIAVTAIFTFLASWNEFLFSLLLTSIEAKTAPIAIAEFKTQYGVEWGTMTALATIYSVPVILFSFFMQKRIVSGMTSGAVKG